MHLKSDAVFVYSYWQNAEFTLNATISEKVLGLNLDDLSSWVFLNVLMLLLLVPLYCQSHNPPHEPATQLL